MTGVSVNAIEGGRMVPSVLLALKLARALETTVDEDRPPALIDPIGDWERGKEAALPVGGMARGSSGCAMAPGIFRKYCSRSESDAIRPETHHPTFRGTYHVS
jgi:hypothetical protein